MTPDRRATAWLVFLCALWGASFFSMDRGVAGMETVVGKEAAPSAFLFLRFLVAAAIFPLAFPRAVEELTPRAALHGFLLTLPFYAGFILQVTGLRGTTPTVSAFITSLTVVTTPVVGRMLFRESVSWANLAGAAVAAAGIYFLTNPTGGGFGRGEFITTLSVVAFAFQIQVVNVVTRRSSPGAVTLVMFLCAVLFSGLTLAALGVGPALLARALLAPDAAWSVAYNAVACSVVAITLMNRFQRDLPPTRAAVIYTLEPVFAGVFAAAYGGEDMTFRKLAGGAIVIAGNLLCEVFRRKGTS